MLTDMEGRHGGGLKFADVVQAGMNGAGRSGHLGQSSSRAMLPAQQQTRQAAAREATHTDHRDSRAPAAKGESSPRIDDSHDHASASTSSHSMLMWLQRLVGRPAQRACKAFSDASDGHEVIHHRPHEVQMACHHV